MKAWQLAAGLLTHLLALSPRDAHASTSNTKRWEHRKARLDESKHSEEFFRFVTRPDLDAPRWNLTVYDDANVSPGHWFLAPYEEVQQATTSDAWNAPHIYDAKGDLIWSGAYLFDGYSIFDFRVSTVGEDPMLTLLSFHEQKAVILDKEYNIFREVSLERPDPEDDRTRMNMHEFTTVEDGTKALYLTVTPMDASKEFSAAIDYDGECRAQYDGFVELDTETWEPTFVWNSYGHIGLDESFVTQDPLETRCDGGTPWDFLHFNSIDKFANGDYLLSGRRSNALYRISPKDNSIVWRLGGRKSDFDLKDGLIFSGQHSAKIYEENDAQLLISFLDNAFGPGDPQTTNDASRGLLLSLDTKAMTAELVQEFKHPHHGYAEGQGNLQWLPDGHAWISWRDRALSTEHAADGTLLMEASFKAGVRTYRSFKHHWVGRPSAPPDLRSAAVQYPDGGRATIVSMSWNGATEVEEWNVYKTNPVGGHKKLVANVPRTGFETTVWVDGYHPNIVVEALNYAGTVLSTSSVTATVPTRYQLDDVNNHVSLLRKVAGNPIVAFLVGMIVTIAAALGAYGVMKQESIRRSLRKTHVYQPVAGEGDKDGDDFDIRDTSLETLRPRGESLGESGVKH